MQPKGHLLRVLGLAFGLAAVVGSVIGQGILRSPGVVAEATGSPALIILLWIGGALIAIVSAFSFAELGAAMPRAGGAYAYIYRAYGDGAGLLAALSLLGTYLATIAMLSFVTGEFMVRLGIGGGQFSAVEMGIAVTALFAAINALGTRSAGGSQIILSSLKGMILIGLVVALFAAPELQPQAVPEPGLLRAGWLPLGTAMLVIIVAYNGWWDVVFYGEEIKNPGRQIPRALFGGIIGVALLYLLVNLAMLHVMTPEQMAGSNLVAADAAGIVFGENADYFLTLFGVLSVGAIGNLSVMTTTRLVYALARAQILPRFMARVDRRGTPMFAMLFAAGIGAALILTGGYSPIISMVGSLNQGATVLAILAVIGLRRREPDLPRPFKTPFYPWPIVVAVVINFLLMIVFIAQDPWYSLSGFVAVAILWAFFAFVLRRRGILEPIEPQEDLP